MCRTLGNIKRNPNVGLLFVKFDGKNRRIRINGKASIHTEKEFLERYYGAKFVVRIECELYRTVLGTSRTLRKRPRPHMFPERMKRHRRHPSGTAGTIFERYLFAVSAPETK
jgi:Pyridoxamine 5'-phosphate oxidase